MDNHTEQIEYLTVKETAALMKLSIPTIIRYTKSGLLTSYKIGLSNVRYRRDEVLSAFKPLDNNVTA
jgi:excisionase family DNA binding protein